MTWEAGTSGNPLGRPKTAIVGEILRKYALSQDGQEKLKAAVRVLCKQAENGDRQSFETIRDTLDGKPTQRVELETDAPDYLPTVAIMQRLLALLAPQELQQLGATIEQPAALPSGGANEHDAG